MRKLSKMAVQLIEQNIENFGCAVFLAGGSLKRSAVFSVFRNKKIDANADNRVRLIIMAHGFNQNATQLVHANHQVV